MKICVLIIFLVLPWISKVGDWALGWTEGNERLQIAFVMMIFPLIMNAMQYYIIDSFIKKKETLEHERLPSEDPDAYPSARHEGTGLRTRRSASDGGRGTDDDDGGGDGDGEELAKPPRKRPSIGVEPQEYDPDVDGDAPTVVGSSSSRRLERARVPRGLFPKE